MRPKTEADINIYKNIPNCDLCKYAAGIYVAVTGELQGKSICPWCLDDLKIKVKNEKDRSSVHQDQ